MAARTRKLLAALVLLAAIAPLLVALVAAHDDGWRPLGDDAVISVLAHDVLSPRSPLVGMPTTLSGAKEPQLIHHPGPLEFWSLAPFERAFGSAPLGILIGVAFVNALAIAAIGAVLYRLAGARAAVTALALCAALAWAFGRQVVVDPWNPYIALFPALLLCVLAWAATAGRRYALWGVALVASYVAQAHLLFVPLAAACFVTATAGLGASWLRRRRQGVLARRDITETVAGTVAVLAIAWAFPIYDQLAHHPGNFTEIWRGLRSNTQPQIGATFALRILVQAIGAPPLFLRRTDSIGIIGVPWHLLGVVRIATALLVVVALVGATTSAFRRRDRVGAAAGTVACVALAVTWTAVAELPGSFPDIPQYRLLQCWIIGGFTWFATGFVIARAVAPRVRRLSAPRRRALNAAALVPIVIVLAAAPIAIAYADSNGHDDPRLYSATERLAAGIAGHLPNRSETYLLDIRGNQGLLGLDVGYGVLRELTRRGFRIGVAPADLYLARSHQAPAGAPHLVIVTGRSSVDAMRRSPDLLLARFGVATSADRVLLAQQTDKLRAYFREQSNLTDKGRAVLSSGAPATDAATLRGLFDGSLDPMALLADDRLGRLWAGGILQHDVFFSGAYDDYAAARQTVDDDVFGAYLEG